MHILHLYDGHERVYRGRGSVPGVVWNVARETAAAGHDVTVLERRWDGLPATARHDGVTFERLDLRTGSDVPWERVPYRMVNDPVGLARLVGDRTVFAVTALSRIRKLDPDVIHVHLPFAANVLVTIAPWFRDRTVFTAHLGELRLNMIDEANGIGEDDHTTDGGLEVPSLLRRVSPDVYLSRRAARTTVLNDAIRNAFLDHGIASDRIRVIPNGVDVARFRDVDRDERQRVRRSYGLDDELTLLFVGTVMPRKGVVELVNAHGELLERTNLDVQLVIAGEHGLDPEYTEQVRTTIRDRRLDDRVTLTGFVPEKDLSALYSLADGLAIPSFEEGFGMTAVEAMAAGTPVVATRVGGLPDVLADGSGVLVDPGDVNALADGLARVLDGAERRARMGERAAERARSYSWETITRMFMCTYGEVIEQ